MSDASRGGTTAAGRWIDVSVPLVSGMIGWPGDEAVRVERLQEVGRGDPCTLTRLVLGTHAGTHVDAPSHYLAGGATLDAMPLDATLGPARVIAISNPVAVTTKELARHRIRPGERLLLRTRNSRRRWWEKPFTEDYVFISPAGARWLAERRVCCVGIDALSVGGFREGGRETHDALLGAGIWIIEGLDLTAVRPGPVDLVCLPLRIAGVEGAPARALVRQRRARSRKTV
jgi:arylformamidase